MKSNKSVEWVEEQCQARWVERDRFRVMCGHPMPCPKHSDREEYIQNLIDKAVEAERERFLKMSRKVMNGLITENVKDVEASDLKNTDSRLTYLLGLNDSAEDYEEELRNKLTKEK
ncbi:MAG: hypothetical protein ACTSQE_07270 [Candidatus Heimdallarchaeaceae archaeon]